MIHSLLVIIRKILLFFGATFLLLIATFTYFAMGFGSELENDETLIKIIDKHGEKLAPIAQIILEEGPDAVIDLRTGFWSTSSKISEIRIEPESFRSRLTQQHISALHEAGIISASVFSNHKGVRFTTGLGGIATSSEETGIVWRAENLEPESVVRHLKDAVLKERKTPTQGGGFEFVRPVYKDWGIFYGST